MQNNRVAWIDLTRGWAMILVVLAHNPIPAKISSYIYSFHVPLFFILSGFLLHGRLDKSWSEFIKSKILSLVVPYFFFSFIAYSYWLLIRNAGLDAGALSISASTPLNGTFLAIRSTDFMTHNAALWFICSLFLSEIIFFAIYKLVKGDHFLLGVSLLGSIVIGIYYNTFYASPLPWSIDTVPIVLVFIGLGYFLKHYFSFWLNFIKNRRKKILIFITLLAISMASWYLNKTAAGTVDMFYSIYGNFVLYFLAASTGALATILFFESFLKQFKALSYIGANSLIIYALHQKVIFGIIALIFFYTLGSTMPFSTSESIGKLLNGVTYLLIALIMLFPMIKLLNIYVPNFIGKAKFKSNK